MSCQLIDDMARLLPCNEWQVGNQASRQSLVSEPARCGAIERSAERSPCNQADRWSWASSWWV